MLIFGYKASAEQFGPAQLLGFAQLAEQVGFDSVFLSDHFQPWKHTGGHSPHAIAWLGALGATTRRIIIGTSVLTPTFRYHPAIIAQAFATLGVMFPGRVILGVGTGEALNEVPATALDWPEAKERFARLREAVTLIRLLWQEQRVSFAGTWYRTSNATLYDRPDHSVPLYIAGAGPLIAKYAGRVADGFICTSGKPAELYTTTLLPNLAAGEQTGGREPGQVTRMIEMKVSFDPDLARARADTRHWAVLSLAAEEKLAVEDPRELERLAAALPEARAASRWIVSADADAHVARLRPYLDMGFRHLVFHAPGEDQERFLRLYADQVLPKLRALDAGGIYR